MVARMLPDKLAMLDAQAARLAHIDAVGALGNAIAVAPEQAAAHQQGPSPARGCQDTILIIDEPDTVHREIGTFSANAGAVVSRNLSPGQGNIPYGYVMAANDENPAAGARAISDHHAL